MKKYLIIISLFLLVACGGKTARLSGIDAAMEGDPTQALIDLEALDTASLSGEERPYYALLMTEARYKNYIDFDSDTLIKVAYSHYNRSDVPDRYIRAHFFNAVAARGHEDYAAAMRDVLPAYEKAKAEADDYWTAKCAELIADIYFDTFNYEQSEKFVRIAIDHYGRANRILNHRYSLTDLAAVYLNESREEDAVRLLDSLEDVVKREQPVDSALLDCIAANRFSACLALGIQEPEYDVAFDLNTLGTVLEQSEACRNRGEFREASSLLELASGMVQGENDTIRYMYGVYRQLMAESDYSRAAALADTLLRQQSDLAGKMLRESVTMAQSDYYKEKAHGEELRSQLYFYILLIALPVLAVIIVLLILLYRMRLRARDAELDAAITSLASYRELAEHTNSEVGRNRELMEELFRERWTTINMLCNEYFERGDTEAARRSITNNIEAELVKLRSKENLHGIEEAVDRYMGGLMSLLRAECPWLKEDDYEFLALIFAGLSARAVCMFTGIKYKYYYLKRSRLTKRLQECDAPHRHLFLSHLKG